MLNRLFPKQLDNRFEGRRPALWLLGVYIALKLAMSLNSIFNTAEVASGADGIPLDTFSDAAAREVLILFAHRARPARHRDHRTRGAPPLSCDGAVDVPDLAR